jgi:hypothetical protein
MPTKKRAPSSKKVAKRAARTPATRPSKKAAAKATRATPTKVADKAARRVTSRRPRFDFAKLVREARKELRVKLERGQTEWGMGTYERFNVDQTRAVMDFFSDSELRLTAKAQVVGSISTDSGTWLWSWANDSILPIIKKRLREVRTFGKKNGIDQLTAEGWDASEADGWSMAAVAASILGSECVYRVPTRSGYVFVLLDEIERVA